jgi:hypothetical protein
MSDRGGRGLASGVGRGRGEFGLSKGPCTCHEYLLPFGFVGIARSYLRRHALPTDLSIGSV